MKQLIPLSWQQLLKIELAKPYFSELSTFVKEQYQEKQCYPPENQIFAAFEYCNLSQVKVVIIGQDPYHGKGQAHGLCFSVNDGIDNPPSLVNIFKEMTTDLDVAYPKNGDLTWWAKQGVLLLNATLTVQAHEAGSHQKKGWETFTDAIIKSISIREENVVFLLWGGYAKKKAKLIDASKHYVLESGHPSPLSANRGYWFGNKHFSKTNTFLKRKGLTQIDW